MLLLFTQRFYSPDFDIKYGNTNSELHFFCENIQLKVDSNDSIQK